MVRNKSRIAQIMVIFVNCILCSTHNLCKNCKFFFLGGGVKNGLYRYHSFSCSHKLFSSSYKMFVAGRNSFVTATKFLVAVTKGLWVFLGLPFVITTNLFSILLNEYPVSFRNDHRIPLLKLDSEIDHIM